MADETQTDGGFDPMGVLINLAGLGLAAGVVALIVAVAF
jgi:hypothetical protein